MAMVTIFQLVFDVAYVCSSKFRHKVFYMKAGKFVRQDHLKMILCGLPLSDRISETLVLQLVIQNLQNDTSADLLELL